MGGTSRHKVRLAGRAAGLVAVGAAVTTVVATTGILEQGGPTPAPVAGPIAVTDSGTSAPPAAVAGPQVAETFVPTPLAVSGVVVVKSAVDNAAEFPGTLDEAPLEAVLAYQRAATIINSAASCQLDWLVLAALGRVQSNHGTLDGTHRVNAKGTMKPSYVGTALNGKKGRASVPDTDAGAIDGNERWDAPVGPFSLLPETWASVAVDADNDNKRNIQDLDDAALGTAVLLCSGGRDLSREKALRKELAAFDDTPHFADTILALAATYDEQMAVVPLPAPAAVAVPEVMPEICECSRFETSARLITTGVPAGSDGKGSASAKPTPTSPTTPVLPTEPTAPTDPTSPTDPTEEPTEEPTEPETPPTTAPEPTPGPSEGPDPVTALTPAQIAALTDAEVAAITEADIAAFTAEQLEAYLARVGDAATPQP